MSEFDASTQWVIDMLLPIREGVIQRKQSITNEWLQNYRAWQGWPKQSYMLPLPGNAIHYFIPHARRAIERNVDRETELAMPNRDWHQALPFDGISHERAEAVQNSLKFIFEKKIPTRRNIDKLSRCLQLYNFAIQHTSVQIQGSEVWPYQEAIDPFNFYLFPETSNDERQMFVIFEESIIPYSVYMSFVNRKDEKKSIYKNLRPEDLFTPEWP